jgi:hypothetical protein
MAEDFNMRSYRDLKDDIAITRNEIKEMDLQTLEEGVIKIMLFRLTEILDEIVEHLK